MSVRWVAGVGCLAVAGSMLVANIGVLSSAQGRPQPNISQVIGVFLLPLILVIAALKLFQKPKDAS